MKFCLNDFEILKVLGIGSMGKITLAQRKDNGDLVALKSISKTSLTNEMRKCILDERYLLSNKFPSNLHLIRIFGAFQSESHMFLVMNYYSGGDFASLLARNVMFPESIVKYYILEVARGLECLHSNGIIHRDLKPENVMLDERGHAVLIDFGLSKKNSNINCRTICGTLEYLAPEIIQNLSYDSSVDWWSLGIFIWELLTGLTPFYDVNHSKIFDRILQGKFSSSIDHVSELGRHLIFGLLERNNKKRLKNISNHPWFFDIINKSKVSNDNFNKMETDTNIVTTTTSTIPISEFGPLFREKKFEKDTSAFEESFTRLPAIITPKSPKPMVPGYSFES